MTKEFHGQIIWDNNSDLTGFYKHLLHFSKNILFQETLFGKQCTTFFEIVQTFELFSHVDRFPRAILMAPVLVPQLYRSGKVGPLRSLLTCVSVLPTTPPNTSNTSVNHKTLEL